MPVDYAAGLYIDRDIDDIADYVLNNCGDGCFSRTDVVDLLTYYEKIQPPRKTVPRTRFDPYVQRFGGEHGLDRAGVYKRDSKQFYTLRLHLIHILIDLLAIGAGAILTGVSPWVGLSVAAVGVEEAAGLSIAAFGVKEAAKSVIDFLKGKSDYLVDIAENEFCVFLLIHRFAWQKGFTREQMAAAFKQCPGRCFLATSLWDCGHRHKPRDGDCNFSEEDIYEALISLKNKKILRYKDDRYMLDW